MCLGVEGNGGETCRSDLRTRAGKLTLFFVIRLDTSCFCCYFESYGAEGGKRREDKEEEEEKEEEKEEEEEGGGGGGGEEEGSLECQGNIYGLRIITSASFTLLRTR